jgi:hypothetical protein
MAIFTLLMVTKLLNLSRTDSFISFFTRDGIWSNNRGLVILKTHDGSKNAIFGTCDVKKVLKWYFFNRKSLEGFVISL